MTDERSREEAAVNRVSITARNERGAERMPDERSREEAEVNE